MQRTGHLGPICLDFVPSNILFLLSVCIIDFEYVYGYSFCGCCWRSISHTNHHLCQDVSQMPFMPSPSLTSVYVILLYSLHYFAEHPTSTSPSQFCTFSAYQSHTGVFFIMQLSHIIELFLTYLILTPKFFSLLLLPLHTFYTLPSIPVHCYLTYI